MFYMVRFEPGYNFFTLNPGMALGWVGPTITDVFTVFVERVACKALSQPENNALEAEFAMLYLSCQPDASDELTYHRYYLSL